MMNPARKHAQEAGLRHYSGQPCRNGHSGRRYTSTRACVDCVKGYGAATPAYRKGQAAASSCRNYERRGIIIGAVNPYKRKDTAAQWAKGFAAVYYGKESTDAKG